MPQDRKVIQCFWCTPLELAEESLRRYRGSGKCPGQYGYHNASVLIGEVPYPASDYNGQGGPNFDRADPRWPEKCDYCDYVFEEKDEWQHNLERIYCEATLDGQLVPGGRRFGLRNAPWGAMWDARWHWEKGPDGRCIYVQTPCGEWCIDSRCNKSHKPWQRSGTPPRITARPSILIGGSTPERQYHGWLTEGVLKEC